MTLLPRTMAQTMVATDFAGVGAPSKIDSESASR